jgi:hypothetical protein
MTTNPSRSPSAISTIQKKDVRAFLHQRRNELWVEVCAARVVVVSAIQRAVTQQYEGDGISFVADENGIGKYGFLLSSRGA